ncbi:MAG: radical SAM/SPASM domain-containing protein, partial [Nitrospirota bacterium]
MDKIKKIIDRIRQSRAHNSSTDISLTRLGLHSLPYFLSPSGRSFSPVVLFLNVSSVCNLKCVHCDLGQKAVSTTFYRNMTNEVRFIDMKTAEKVFSEVKKYKPTIAIISTEPLLHRHIIKIVELAKSQGLRIYITSNGYLLRRYAEKIVESGLDKLCISLDGLSEVHNRIRGVSDSFERAVEGIKMVVAHRKKTGSKLAIAANMVLCSQNYAQIDEYIGYLSGIGIEQFVFSYFNYVTREMSDIHNRKWGEKYPMTSMSLSGGLNYGDVEPEILYKQIMLIKNKYKHLHISFIPHLASPEAIHTYFREPFKFVTYDRCFVPWMTATIMPNGDVTGICRCFNLIFGNVNE